jgi:hypothetical protein
MIKKWFIKAFNIAKSISKVKLYFDKSKPQMQRFYIKNKFHAIA